MLEVIILHLNNKSSDRYGGRIAEPDTTAIPSSDTTPLLSYAAGHSSSNFSGQRQPASYTAPIETPKKEIGGGSILIVVVTVFLQSISFTITMPSMAYYVESVCCYKHKHTNINHLYTCNNARKRIAPKQETHAHAANARNHEIETQRRISMCCYKHNGTRNIKNA